MTRRQRESGIEHVAKVLFGIDRIFMRIAKIIENEWRKQGRTFTVKMQAHQRARKRVAQAKKGQKP